MNNIQFKQLVWEDDFGDLKAHTIGGQYNIRKYMDKSYYFVQLDTDAYLESLVDNIENIEFAQKIAQQHHENRILEFLL